MSVCLFFRPCVWLYVDQSVCLCVCPYVCQSARLSVCLSIYPCLSVCTSVCLFDCKSFCLSIQFVDACPSIRPFVCLSIPLFVRLSIHQFDIYSKPLLKPQYTYNKPCFETAYLSENAKIIVWLKSSSKCCHFWATFSEENHCQKIFLNIRIRIFLEFLSLASLSSQV
jgi:hypothetical protein